VANFYSDHRARKVLAPGGPEAQVCVIKILPRIQCRVWSGRLAKISSPQLAPKRTATATTTRRSS